MISLLVLLFCQLANAQLLNNTAYLTVDHINVVERHDQFSLEIDFKKIEQKNMLLNLFESDKANTEPQPIEIDENLARTTIKITPELPFTLSHSQYGLILLGHFKPETDYTVQISRQMKDKLGASLKEAYSQNVHIGNFKPQFSFLNKSRYLPPSLQENIAYETINLVEAEVSIRQVYNQNIHQLLSNSDNVGNNLSDIIKIERINIKNQKDRKIKGSLSLESLKPIGQGIFYLEAKANDAKLDSTIVVITDLGAVLKLGENQSLRVWTFKNTNLKPLQAVEVLLHSESNFKMGQCTTKGSRGYCEISWSGKNRLPFAVTLKKGIDQSYLRLSDLELASEEFDGGPRNYFLKNQTIDAFIYSERNHYRAGETIYLAAQLRNLKFESQPARPVVWKIYDPNGIQYKEFITKTSGNGVARLDLPTHMLYPNGIYTAEIYAEKTLLHSYKFRVESFIPERFSLKLKAQKKLVLDESKVKFDIEAKGLLDNQPISAQYSATCAIEEAYQFIPNHPEFQTGTYIPSGQKKIPADNVSGFLKRGTNSSYKCDYGKILGNLPKTVYKVTSDVMVSELNNLTQVRTSANTILSAKNFNIGIKTQQNPENNSVSIEGMLFDLDGNYQKVSHKISVELLQIQENWIAIQQSNETKWKVIETINPKSIIRLVESKDGAFQAKLTPPLEWRKWIVRATDLQTKVVTEISQDSLLSISENTKFEKIEIKVNKPDLMVGEKFTVTLIPPFRGELLVSIESFKVIEHQWLSVDKIQPIELDFKAPDANPNFYVTALLLKEPIHKQNKLITNRAWATKSLQIIPKKNTLNIDIKTPLLIESLNELSIKISNRERISADYSVGIIDEELTKSLQLKLPNPLQRFFDPRKLNARTFESLNSMVAKQLAENETKNIELPPVSLNGKDKVLTHFWFPEIKSNKKGEAEVKVKIPNFQGKLKVFVIGSGQRHAGASETVTDVKDSVNAKMILPDFLTINDHFDFFLFLSNSQKTEDSVKISVGTTGPIILEKNQFEESLKAEGDAQIIGKGKSLDFPEPLKLTFNSQQKNFGKNVVEEIQLQNFSNGIEKFQQFLTPADKRLDLITALPPIWKKNFLKIHLALSNVPFLGIYSHLSGLWQNPYGNLEQTVSSILPLIGEADLLSLSEGIDPKIATIEVRTKIQNTLNQISSQQNLDGGFSLWPNSYKSQAWVSAFATLALCEANSNGFLISPTILQKALNYLQQSLQTAAKEWQWHENDNPELSLGLYLLAKNKKNISNELKSINKNLINLSQKSSEAFGYENLFLLAITAKMSGQVDLLNKITANRELAKKIFSEPFNDKIFSASNFWSPLRMDGLRLNILLEQWPEHPAIKILTTRLIEKLAEPKMFFSSQDLVWPLFAFNKYLKTFKIASQKLNTIKLQFNNKKYLPNYYVRGIPVWFFSGDELLSSSFDFPELEKTNLVFHTKVSGFTMSPPPSLSPITIERAYLLPDGSEADETDLKIGDLVIVELRIFNARSIHFRSVAIIDRLPAGASLDNPRAYSESIPWMSKNIFNTEYYNFIDNRLQVFGELTETEKVYYYQIRATHTGKFKAPSAKVELMYIPESFDFSSEASLGVSH
jgi:uncharacterized protein YfaS (alpha-2-macroglobulin family)